MDEKRKDALKQAMVIRFGGFAIIVAVLLYFFGQNYWQGWLYWAVLFVPMSFVVLYFLNRDSMDRFFLRLHRFLKMVAMKLHFREKGLS